MNYIERLKKDIKEERDSKGGNLMPQKIQIIIQEMLQTALSGLTPDEINFINEVGIDTIPYGDINELLKTEHERVILSNPLCQVCKKGWSSNEVKLTKSRDLYICNNCLSKIKDYR